MTMDANEDVSVEELERELPVVWDEMVPLGELVSRVAQDLYTQLGELAETCVCGCIQYQRIEYSIDVMLHVPQDAGDERRGTQTRRRGLGRQQQEAGRQALCRRQMGQGCRCRSQVDRMLRVYQIGYVLMTFAVFCSQNIVAFLLEQRRQFDDAIEALTNSKNALATVRSVSALYCCPNMRFIPNQIRQPRHPHRPRRSHHRHLPTITHLNQGNTSCCSPRR
jgi:hypothetical protein